MAEDEINTTKTEEIDRSIVFDDEGTPYKNLYKEFQRKHEEEVQKRELAETERDNAKRERDEMQVTFSKKTAEEKADEKSTENEEDEWTLQQRQISKQESEKAATVVYQREERSKVILYDILDRMELDDPRLKKYRGEIITQMLRMAWDLRQNPHSVSFIAYSILGKDKSQEKGTESTDKKRLVSISSEVLSPTPNINKTMSVQLTNEEMEFADEKRLWDKFDESEIREMYKNRQEKLNKKKG